MAWAVLQLQGLGATVARYLARQGAKVIVSARSEDKLQVHACAGSLQHSSKGVESLKWQQQRQPLRAAYPWSAGSLNTTCCQLLARLFWLKVLQVHCQALGAHIWSCCAVLCCVVMRRGRVLAVRSPLMCWCCLLTSWTAQKSCRRWQRQLMRRLVVQALTS